MPIFLAFFWMGCAIAALILFLISGNPMAVVTEIIAVGFAFYHAFFSEENIL